MQEQTVNIPLLRKAVEWAEAEAAKPWELSEWYQGDWVSSPTTIAADSEDAEYFGIQVGTTKAAECGTCYCIAGYVCEVQGLDTKHSWDMHAADALGISPNTPLFNAHNTIEDVRRIAEDIAGERL